MSNMIASQDTLSSEEDFNRRAAPSWTFAQNSKRIDNETKKSGSYQRYESRESQVKRWRE